MNYERAIIETTIAVRSTVIKTNAHNANMGNFIASSSGGGYFLFPALLDCVLNAPKKTKP